MKRFVLATQMDWSPIAVVCKNGTAIVLTKDDIQATSAIAVSEQSALCRSEEAR